MTATVHPEQTAIEQASTPTTTEAPAQRWSRYVAAVTRLSLGWIFLWAFLDKTFALGHETAHADAWIRGGSPTKGFLAFGTAGPFKELYASIAGQPWADALFMIGLAGIGIALIM